MLNFLNLRGNIIKLTHFFKTVINYRSIYLGILINKASENLIAKIKIFNNDSPYASPLKTKIVDRA